MKTAEQKARDMLETVGFIEAHSFSAGDLVELANLIDSHDQLVADNAALREQLALLSGHSPAANAGDQATAIVDHVYEHVGFRNRDRLIADVQAMLPQPTTVCAGDLAERIKQKVMGRLELRGLLADMTHNNVRILGYEFLSDLEAVLPNDGVKEMVNRFLGWPLPKTFGPDCGITFDGRKDDEWNKNKSWPIGTNLLTADEAKAMFEYCLRPTALTAAGTP
jgi:hypothetical protein